METEAVLILAIIAGFLGIIGLKALKSYNSTELKKHTNGEELKMKDYVHFQDMKTQRQEWSQRVKDAQNNRNYWKGLHDDHELDYEDMEGDEEFKLSDIATAVYPKIPPSLKNLIDKEEFQNAIIKTVEKKPDILNTFIDKFLTKPKEDAAPQQQVVPSDYL